MNNNLKCLTEITTTLRETVSFQFFLLKLTAENLLHLINP